MQYALRCVRVAHGGFGVSVLVCRYPVSSTTVDCGVFVLRTVVAFLENCKKAKCKRWLPVLGMEPY